jgi:hypothetical protein
MMGRRYAFLCVLALAGCTREVDKAELPGRYEFSVDNLKQQITISADGKYTNALYRDGTLSWSDQRTWDYEKVQGKFGVTFNEFRFGIPGYSSQPGYWFVVPEKTLTGVKELCFDPDNLYQCFRTD